MQRSPAALGWLLVLALALGLRVGAVAWLDSAERRAAAYEHGRIAENLVAGRGFTITFLGVEGPTSQQAPLYPLMLAGLYTAFAPAAPEAHLAMQLLQCLAGTALVACVVWCVRIFLPGRPAAAWVAGAGAAVYPPHVYMVTHLQVAVWVALLLALAVCVACSPRWQRSTWGAGLLGLV